MKTSASTILLSALLISFVLAGCGKKEDNVTTQKDTKTNTPTQTPPPVQSNTDPPKIGMIWSQIEKKTEALGQVIQGGKAGHLDEPIGEVVNLLKTLPAKSTGLESSKLDLIKTKISEMEKLGSSMDNFQHSNKNAEVIKEYGKFIKSLGEIKSQYPSESFN